MKRLNKIINNFSVRVIKINPTLEASKEIIDQYQNLLVETIFAQESLLEGALFLAIYEEDVKAVEAMILANADVNYVSKITQKSLLQYAIEKRNLEIINLFLECKDINLNAKTFLGENFLFLVIEHRLWEHAYKMIAKNVDIETTTSNDSTILHYLAVFNHEELMKDCLEVGLNINYPNHFGHTPLHLAILEGSFKIVQILLDHEADLHIKDNVGITPMDLVKQSNNSKLQEIVKRYDKSYKDPVSKDNSYYKKYISYDIEEFSTELEIISAINKNDLKSIIAIINSGANINCYSIINGKFHLEYAIEKHHQEIVKTLVTSKNINLNYRSSVHGENALHQAIKHELWDCANLIIEKRSDLFALTSNKSTMLHYLAVYPNKNLIQYMLKRGLNINAADDMGRTPLHLAIMKGDMETVKLLLNNEAKFDVIDQQGQTPFELAVYSKNKSIKDLFKPYSIIDEHELEVENIGELQTNFTVMDFLQGVLDKYSFKDYAATFIGVCAAGYLYYQIIDNFAEVTNAGDITPLADFDIN